MNSDFSRKLFIFVGLLFLFLMLGPYFGVHPFGTPLIPKREDRFVLPPALSIEDDSLPPETDPDLIYPDGGSDQEEESSDAGFEDLTK